MRTTNLAADSHRDRESAAVPVITTNTHGASPQPDESCVSFPGAMHRALVVFLLQRGRARTEVLDPAATIDLGVPITLLWLHKGQRPSQLGCRGLIGAGSRQAEVDGDQAVLASLHGG